MRSLPAGDERVGATPEASPARRDTLIKLT